MPHDDKEPLLTLNGIPQGVCGYCQRFLPFSGFILCSNCNHGYMLPAYKSLLDRWRIDYSGLDPVTNAKD